MNITILGAGLSGTHAAILAKHNGENVFLSEYSNEDKYIDNIKLLDEANIEYEFGSHSVERILKSDLIIVSPGIPPSAEIIKKIEAKNIEIIGELEYSYRYLKGNPVIAVTGTNGKTTTVNLIHHIFKTCGKKSHLVGNVGTPLSAIVENVKASDIIILEVSSYQLDRINIFAPDIAIVLNISEDHLSYHGSFVEYAKAKWRITQKQKQNNFLILNQDDNEISKMLLSEGGQFQTKAEKRFFTCSTVSSNDVSKSKVGTFIRDGKIIIVKHKDGKTQEEELMQINQLSLPGNHNLYNSMAAIMATRAFEVRNEDIRDALMGFGGVEHRLEEFAELNGVRFINDSKATNVNAAWYALSSYKSNIIWLSGGRGDNDYSVLDKYVNDRVKTIISFGEEADNIFNHFCSMTKCEKLQSLEKAVGQAFFEAEKGDIILFSPACKSFDMFANFEHRGLEFKRYVSNLANQTDKQRLENQSE